MKKLLTGIAAMAFIVSIGTTTAFAAGNGWGCKFIDTDNDGICDYYHISCPFIDSNGDGICDNIAERMPGNGTGFHRGHFGGQCRWR